jgi:hypothetical protein
LFWVVAPVGGAGGGGGLAAGEGLEDLEAAVQVVAAQAAVGERDLNNCHPERSEGPMYSYFGTRGCTNPALRSGGQGKKR